MKANVGDELIIGSPELAHSGRIGTIALTNHDGSPPYVVWSLAGYESLVFPGRCADRTTSRAPGRDWRRCLDTAGDKPAARWRLRLTRGGR
jgi:hypothetical protein